MIGKEIDEIIEMYLENIRIHVVPQRESLRERLFLTHTGNEFTKISKTMQQVANICDQICEKGSYTRIRIWNFEEA